MRACVRVVATCDGPVDGRLAGRCMGRRWRGAGARFGSDVAAWRKNMLGDSVERTVFSVSSWLAGGGVVLVIGY